MLLYVNYISIKLFKKSEVNESFDTEQAIFQTVVLESERWVGVEMKTGGRKFGWAAVGGPGPPVLWCREGRREPNSTGVSDMVRPESVGRAQK